MYILLYITMLINDDIKLIGATDLRTEIPKLTKDMKVKTVIVMKRGKPVAVLEDYEKYEEKRKILDTFEDLVLGYMAKERYESTAKNRYIDEKKVAKKLGITL